MPISRNARNDGKPVTNISLDSRGLVILAGARIQPCLLHDCAMAAKTRRYGVCEVIDLSKLKVGDIVNFRCGGSFTIGSFLVRNPLGISYSGLDLYWRDDMYGKISTDLTDHPFDIISITPAKPDELDVVNGLKTIRKLLDDPNITTRESLRIICERLITHFSRDMKQ